MVGFVGYVGDKVGPVVDGVVAVGVGDVGPLVV